MSPLNEVPSLFNFFEPPNSCNAKPIHGKIIQPNIVLFLVDDLGWGDVGYMGSKYYETPNINKLSKNGVIFTNNEIKFEILDFNQYRKYVKINCLSNELCIEELIDTFERINQHIKRLSEGVDSDRFIDLCTI